MKRKASKSRNEILKIEVVDLFCGIGGLSFGMKSKGFNILAGYDLDSTCRYAYETNNDAKFIYKDIKTVTADEIRSRYSKIVFEYWLGAPHVSHSRRMLSK